MTIETIEDLRKYYRPWLEERENPSGHTVAVTHDMAIVRADGRVWNHEYRWWAEPRQYDDEDFSARMALQPDRVLICGNSPEMFDFIEQFADDYLIEDTEDFYEEDWYIVLCACDDPDVGTFGFVRIGADPLPDE